MSKYTPRSSISTVGQSYSRGRNVSGSGLNSDYEEFASLQLDRPNEAELKTTEEMKKHMFDEHFESRPIERAMHILSVGEEVQRLSVIRDLPVLVSADEEGCMNRVIPKIQQALSTAPTEFHIETARSYSIILEKKVVSPHMFARHFLPSVIFHVENRDQVAANAWLETLLIATENLPLDIVKNNIFGIAINKGQISQNVTHRIASCKLLGIICSRFESNIVKKDILPVVLSLCQDINESVRASICSQLHLVAKGVPPDMIKSALIPILVELGRDETVMVRVEATETIVKIIPFLSPDLIKVSIIPLIRKICEQAAVAMDETLVMVAKQFGSLCISLENILTQSEKLWLVTYYHNLSHMGVPIHGPKKEALFTTHGMDRVNARYIECRQFCAYNFPAMAKFSSSSPELLEKIYPSFCDFSTDPYYMVRKTIGAGMHEVARILGKNNRVVKNQVMTLLWDNMEEVLMGIVPHLGKTIDHLISSGVLGHEQDTTTLELGRGLLQCDKTIRDKTHNWRLYTDFIKQLESVVKCLPSDYIYSHFVSLMFDKMHRARPLPCRLAAARTLLIFLRYNLKNNQRQEIRSRLQSEFCLSSSCYKRMLYLRLCNTAREVFSRAYFKEHFFYPLLSRSEDKVANNRLLLIRQFPSLKAMIVMPSEKKYLQTLESCIRSMAVMEKDRDVTAELRVLIHRIDKTETLMENSANQTAADVEDRRKYEEEVRVANNALRFGIQGTGSDNRRTNYTPAQREGPAKPPGTTQPPLVQQQSQYSHSQQQQSQQQHVQPRPRPQQSAAPSSSGIPGSRFDSISSTLSTQSSASSSYSHSGTVQGYNNTTNNLISIRSSFSPHKTNIDRSCTCYPTPSYFGSESLRNLNLLALIDSNLVSSKQKFSELIKQKLNEDPRLKMVRSSKRSMEISWLNLEMDLKNELFALLKSRQIHGDRNLKEKSKFLTDFRHHNEPNLSKFINEDRDKETIYNVTGIGGSNYEKSDSSFFEERLNFFERKIKLDDAKTYPTNTGDFSCLNLTTNKTKHFQTEDTKAFSYFSKNFEDEFYRDAGVKANEIIGKKIPICDRPIGQISPKISSLLSNKRRTWFAGENISQDSTKQEAISSYPLKGLEKKMPETVAAPVSLKNIGIGPRSKSFVFSNISIYSDKYSSGFQSVDNNLQKKIEDTGNVYDTTLKPDSGSNRFGYRSKSAENSPKVEAKSEKTFARTKIPVGRTVNGASPAGSRSVSPVSSKDKPDENTKPQINGTKKIPSIVSRKSMLIQSSSLKSELKNNRRSLDSTKISLANLDKGVTIKKKNEKATGKSNFSGGNVFESEEKKGEKETSVSSNTFSKLPIRKPKPNSTNK